MKKKKPLNIFIIIKIMNLKLNTDKEFLKFY